MSVVQVNAIGHIGLRPGAVVASDTYVVLTGASQEVRPWCCMELMAGGTGSGIAHEALVVRPIIRHNKAST